MGFCNTICSLKAALFIFSFFLWGCAFTLVGIGAWILFEYNQFGGLYSPLPDISPDVLYPSFVLIGAGILIVIIGILGCASAVKHNKCLLALFFISVLTLLVIEVTAIGLTTRYQNSFEADFTKHVNELVDQCRNKSYGVSKNECVELDYFQTKLKCCGATSYKDWYIDGNNSRAIPSSCCRNRTQTSCISNVDNLYQRGCASLITSDLNGALLWMFVATVICVIIQVLGLVATIMLMCQRKEEETPYEPMSSQDRQVQTDCD